MHATDTRESAQAGVRAGLAMIEAALNGLGLPNMDEGLPALDQWGTHYLVPTYRGRGPSGEVYVSLQIETPHADSPNWKVIDERSGEAVLAREDPDFLARDLAQLINHDRMP